MHKKQGHGYLFEPDLKDIEMKKAGTSEARSKQRADYQEVSVFWLAHLPYIQLYCHTTWVDDSGWDLI
jgi:hypothetical protein